MHLKSYIFFKVLTLLLPSLYKCHCVLTIRQLHYSCSQVGVTDWMYRQLLLLKQCLQAIHIP